MTRLLLIKFTLPACLIAFLTITMRIKSSLGDEQMLSFGFPLSWYSPSNAASMAYTIAAVPLIIDLLCYVAFSYVLALTLPTGRILTSKYDFILTIALWVCVPCGALFTYLIIFSDPLFVIWTLNDYFSNGAAHDYNIQIGPGLAE